MDNVVNLRTGSKAQSSARGKRRPTRKRADKTALVLGGGGFTGGVYEIGALRALDLLAVNSTVNDFDMYVGTSAGSFIATMLASGVTPEEMMRVLTDDDDAPIERLSQDVMLKPNFGEYARKAVGLPWHVAGLVKSLLPRIGDVSAIDFGYGLARKRGGLMDRSRRRLSM